MKAYFLPTITTLFTAILLMSCAQRYSMSTNLDKENFSDYFSPSAVKIIEDEQAFTGKYRYLSLVEGESCQVKAHHETANEIDARTDARKKAHQLGANAIVFTGCTLIENNEADKRCITTRVCYGKAYQVEQSVNE